MLGEKLSLDILEILPWVHLGNIFVKILSSSEALQSKSSGIIYKNIRRKS